MKKPVFAKLVATLDLIRRSNENIRYAYILRQTSKKNMAEFVADADALNSVGTADTNKDGIIDGQDEIDVPGTPYNIVTYLPMQALFKTGKATADAHPETDEWGTFLSGYAPINDSRGNVYAMFAVDMYASKLDEFSAESFTPLLAFISLFLLFACIRFTALNRSLLQECWQEIYIKKRCLILWMLFSATLVLGLLYSFHLYTKKIIIEQTGARLMSIAITAAKEFDPKDLNQLHWAKDMQTDAYQRVFKKINDVRNENPIATYAYVVRPTRDPDLFEFIADADSNFSLPTHVRVSLTDRSPLRESDENIWPGYIYDDSGDKIFAPSFKRPAYARAFDQWGSAVTGCAPIFDKDNHLPVAIFCLDTQLDAIQE